MANIIAPSDILEAIPKWLEVILISATPFAELRLGLPVAMLVWNIDPIPAYLLSVIGNLAPVLPLLFFWKFVAEKIAARFKFFRRFSERLYAKIKHRNAAKFKTLKELALLIFVAIPLPGTGVWTASVAATVFKIPIWRAALMIGLGVLIAGGLVLLMFLGLPNG